MIKFEDAYFIRFRFDKEQVEKNFENASKDLRIAKKDSILEVKFSYAYSAFIKGGIALLSANGIKVKSMPGHHTKLIEKMSEILKNDTAADIGNAMRSKRNIDFYSGGVEVTEKECKEYIEFVDKVLENIRLVIDKS